MNFKVLLTVFKGLSSLKELLQLCTPAGPEVIDQLLLAVPKTRWKPVFPSGTQTVQTENTSPWPSTLLSVKENLCLIWFLGIYCNWNEVCFGFICITIFWGTFYCQFCDFFLSFSFNFNLHILLPFVSCDVIVVKHLVVVNVLYKKRTFKCLLIFTKQIQKFCLKKSPIETEKWMRWMCKKFQLLESRTNVFSNVPKFLWIWVDLFLQQQDIN